jgi:hypothetical protein
VDGIAFEVDCATIVVKEGEVDIGSWRVHVCNRMEKSLTSDLGGNPSADEAAEALEDGAQTVNNVVHSFRLQSTQFDKKSYLTYLKGYMKAVKEHLQKVNPDRVADFEKGAQAFAKKVVANFKDYEFVRDRLLSVSRLKADVYISTPASQ